MFSHFVFDVFLSSFSLDLRFISEVLFHGSLPHSLLLLTPRSSYPTDSGDAGQVSRVTFPVVSPVLFWSPTPPREVGVVSCQTTPVANGRDMTLTTTGPRVEKILRILGESYGKRYQGRVPSLLLSDRGVTGDPEVSE